MEDPEVRRRSEMMSKVRNKNTLPERRVRQILHRLGYRFRLQTKSLPGKPDIVLPKWRTVVFVHGCFWHGHDCPRGKAPATNVEFWETKLLRNRERDAKALIGLRELGWQTIVVWQCELKDVGKLESKLRDNMKTHE